MAGQDNDGRQTASEREQGIIDAYMAGAKWSEIEDRFGVGRSTISHVLRRSGVVPSRVQRRLDSTSAETALTRLYELIAFQDRRIIELEALKSEHEEKLRRHGIGLDGSKPRRKPTKRPRARNG